MQVRNLLTIALAVVTGVKAGLVPDKCDTCALIVVDLDVCLDIFDQFGNCDPVKACPCWEQCIEAGGLTAELEVAIDNALSACACATL